MFGQLESAGRGEESVLCAREGGWALEEEFVLGLYVSTLPCTFSLVPRDYAS